MKSILLAATIGVASLSFAHEPFIQPSTQPAEVDPKPLSKNVDSAIAWLLKMQRADGGWSQGEESAQMSGSRNAEDGAAGEPSNVADTCMAMLALVRSGSTPTSGAHAESLAKSVSFLCSQIEKSDAESLWVTDVRGTRTQGKLGTYVDTYLAALVLSEIKPSLVDGELKTRVGASLDKTIGKMQSNKAEQQGQNGWAVALSRGIAGKAMNKAAAVTASVDLGQLAGDNAKARETIVTGAGGRAEFAPAADAAGVGLYGAASSIQQLQEAVNADRRIEASLRRRLAEPTTSPSERDDLEKKLGEVKQNADKLVEARQAVVGKMNDEQFIAGFGSNGGEEFLSYWAIGETLVTERDPAFADWDKKMTDNLTRVQNDDGSWSGHHCITGKTFCTSASLLVLMVDRTNYAVTGDVRAAK